MMLFPERKAIRLAACEAARRDCAVANDIRDLRAE
jgi:hypothetical protein